MDENQEITTESTEEEMFHQWCDEQSDIAGDIMDAMVKTCADKLTEQGMIQSDVSYVEETLFSDAASHEVYEAIWNALMRI
jgi:hypothetical protein